MAVVQHRTTKQKGVATTTWEGLTSANAVGSGESEIPSLADKTVQVVGTFDSATLVIQGSNNGVNWGTLNDAEGNPLSFTAEAGPVTILENPGSVRPSTSGGGGSQDIDVIIVAKK